MRLAALILAMALAALPSVAPAREVVTASEPVALAVTIYRDPIRGPDEQMDSDWPQGFAMISEARTVTLPPGESTIRFEGVAEGMVAVSAIVTGLPGGTIEKNRNSDLLSPASLIDGTLGNHVTVTRTNPATGEAVSEPAIVRTRADGGLVLQTGQGFEAVRCSGLPEKLVVDRIPAGLSAQPVFSVDTRDPAGGTYRVVLTYLAWGFDWQAHYVVTLGERGRGSELGLQLMSWLTLLNDNGQSFPDAHLMAVAGTLNIDSDYGDLADPPEARPLRLTCYPLGSTATGSPISYPPPPSPPPPPPPPAPAMMESAAAIVVTGSRVSAPVAMMAQEEQLGDLKLYRMPEPIDVAAKGLKQIAFLRREDVEGELLYIAHCPAGDLPLEADAMRMVLETINDREHGLGVALPSGGMTIFEPSPAGDLLVGEEVLRDYAVGQDVEIALGASTQVFARCGVERREDDADGGLVEADLTNANPTPVKVRLYLGLASDWEKPGRVRGVRVKDGAYVLETTVPANSSRRLNWRMEPI